MFQIDERCVKSLGEGRVGGYLVVWGDAHHRDLQGEYFTPETDLALEWYNCRPALYHHGLDNAVKSALIGAIDTLTPDETGVWAEAQLDLRHKYTRALSPRSGSCRQIGAYRRHRHAHAR